MATCLTSTSTVALEEYKFSQLRIRNRSAGEGRGGARVDGDLSRRSGGNIVSRRIIFNVNGPPPGNAASQLHRACVSPYP